ncbi:hypothetical protein CAL28_19860 [Bordetella genomosp. 11]|uniref:Lipoprotein n=1 Tax=Bordetella genomosp. 11 TaxID=1416808 RepID=A0A261UIU9_9BORD|nr:hypothetical protein CAL28_19860 [Bordetella genomosp. 11]
MWKTTLLPCLLVPLLASCATTGQPVAETPIQPEVQVKTRVIDTGCDWNKPIYVDPADVLTDGTAKQILAHNLAGAKNCGWKPRK